MRKKIVLGCALLLASGCGGDDGGSPPWNPLGDSSTGSIDDDGGDDLPEPEPTASGSMTSGVDPSTSGPPPSGSATGETGEDESSDGGESSSSTGSTEGPLCDLLTFDDDSTAPWAELAGTVTMATLDNELEFAIPAGVGFGILQRAETDVRGTVFRIRATQFSASGPGTIFGINLDSGPNTERIAIQLHDGTLELHHVIPGDPIVPEIITAPALPFEMRLRTEGGTVYYETSTDGTSWTTHRQIAEPAFVDAANANVTAGNWDDVAQAHIARVDEVELCTISP